MAEIRLYKMTRDIFSTFCQEIPNSEGQNKIIKKCHTKVSKGIKQTGIPE